MKLKKILPLLLIPVLAISGCSLWDSPDESISYIQMIDGVVTDETSVLGISAKETKLEELLTDNTFYVVHNGTYYPFYTSMTNEVYDEFELDDAYASRNGEMMFYTTEDEMNIPTLFPGDTIIYYSTTKMLETIYWERYYDCGMTFGLRDLKRTKAGRYYLDLSNSDIKCVLPNTSLSPIEKFSTDYVLVDKVGGVEIRDSSVRDGIIMGATKNQSYDFELYTGTNYQYITGVANIHAFKDYELYESLEFKTLREHFWQIDVPEYVVEGYYNINHCGMVRVCKDVLYSDQTNFNEQFLFPELNNMTYGYSDTESYQIEDYYDYLTYYEDKYYDNDLKPAVYTTEEELLKSEDQYKYLTTNIQGAPGYVEPKDVTDIEEGYIPEQYTEEEIVRLTKANIIRYELWFPKGKKCKLTIKTNEGTGSAYVKFANGSKNELTFNKFDGVYETEFNGAGIEGIITISGLTKDYDIVLTNVDIYDNQDKVTDTPAEPAETENEPTEEKEEE